MKIFLATDGSEQSQAAFKEVSAKPFPINTKVRIVSACERTPLITKLEPMGVSREFYAKAEKFGADLIVVGSHGYGMVEGFLLGSVSNAVALHAACSVEIVRSRKRRTSESKKQ